jgi:hypothetical protein
MQRSNSDEAVFLIDLATGAADAMLEITLQSVGLKERGDLQRWITEHPEIVGRDLLLVTTEFDQWEIRDQKVADRLDVLFLDTDGSPVVAELKRDLAEDTIELQALKYAAYCSQLTVDDIVEQYSRHHKVDLDMAHAAVEDHAPSVTDGELGPIRIRLVAGGFGPSVTTVVLWLRDHDIDIGCIQVTARRHDNGTAILAARQLLPLPEAEDYLVRRRRKEQDEEARKSTRRALNSVTLLDQAGVTHPGDKLELKVSQFTAEQRPKVEALVEGDPSIAEAEWTGLGIQRALRWAHDGNEYSCTGITKAILERVGIHLDVIAGPDYWLLPTGRAVYEEAKLIEKQIGDDATPAAPEPQAAN